MKIAALILAAGEGKRMSRIGRKPFLKIENLTFLESAISKCKSIQAEPIIIVINKKIKDKMTTIKNANVIINPHPENGMLSSIVCGLNVLDDSISGCIINPVDFPVVTSETYRKLVDKFFENQNFIIKPVMEGRGGHPIIIPAHFFDEIKKIPLSTGLRLLIKNNQQYIQFVEVNDPGILININTPDLYFKYGGNVNESKLDKNVL